MCMRETRTIDKIHTLRENKSKHIGKFHLGI